MRFKRRKKTIRWKLLIPALFIAGIVLFFVGSKVITSVQKYIAYRNVPDYVLPPDFNRRAAIPVTEMPQATPVPVSKTIRIPIIMYHYVEYVKDENDTIRRSLSINPYLFERHLIQLKENHYTTYFVREVPGLIDRTTPIASKSAVLTFDDGYADFYYDAFPLLKKYQVKATVYIITDYIGWEGFLNKQQIQELLDSGLVEIGSHTLDHYNLKYVASSEAKRQIVESKQYLEETFNTPIETFAYPFGGFNDDVVQITKEASYSAAVSVIPGMTQSPDNLFYLSRIRAGSLTAYGLDEVLENWKDK